MASKSNMIVFMTSLLLLIHFNFCRGASAPQPGGKPAFEYIAGTDGEPAKWGKLNPQWQVCETGKQQSPIDLSIIRAKVVRDPDLLEILHKPAPAFLKSRGHDIMISWKQDAGNIVIEGVEYKLKQCHWHTPAEHKINGRRFPLELHMVHENAEGRIAVIGVLYRYGRPNPFLSRVMNAIESVGEREIELGEIDPNDMGVDPRLFFRYVGSLTSPPCAEGVIWTVTKKVGTVSRDQVQALSKAHLPGYEANARPIQELNGRQIWCNIP